MKNKHQIETNFQLIVRMYRENKAYRFLYFLPLTQKFCCFVYPLRSVSDIELIHSRY